MKGHGFNDVMTNPEWFLLNMVEGVTQDKESAEETRSNLRHGCKIVNVVTSLNNENPDSTVKVKTMFLELRSFVKGYDLNEEQRLLEQDTEITLSNGNQIIYWHLYNKIANAAKCKAKNIQLNAEETQLTPKQLRYLGPNQGIYTIDDAFVRFSVIDDGKGIDEENLPRIYGSGYSATGSTALTDLVCRTLHGYERVESSTEGTTFELYVPKERKERPLPKQLELPF